MGTEPSLSSGGDTSEKDPSPTRNEEQSQERVFGSGLMEMDGDFLGLDENKLEMSEILDQIHGKASSILEFSVKWEAIEERYTSLEDLLKERAMEIELKEKSVMERTVELEKKEERLKEVEERERKIGLLEKSVTVRLVEKEKEFDVIQDLVSGVMRLVCEKANEEVTNELEERVKEVERLSKSNDVKSCEFDLKQKEFVVSIDEDPEPLICYDSEFHDFSKTMGSFVVGKAWALYDPIDEMPRLFGRIKREFLLVLLS